MNKSVSGGEIPTLMENPKMNQLNNESTLMENDSIFTALASKLRLKKTLWFKILGYFDNLHIFWRLNVLLT